MSEGLRRSALASLSLGPGAGDEEIRTAYRRLAMRYHPDASGDPRSAKRFSRVVRAYRLLVASGVESPRLRVPRYRSVEEAGSDLFALGQVLAADPDAGARGAAARALGLSGRSAAYIFIRRALYDHVEDVALEAVRAAALIGSRQAEGEVAALFARAEPSLRLRILELALATGERLFRSTLEAASKAADPRLRSMAQRGLEAERDRSDAR